MGDPEPLDPARRKKLSERVAGQILAEIASREWPLGQLIGTEAELMARFSVSRGTLSEAIRQVERHGVAEMRRGGSGGLVVSGSALTSTSRAISTYLELCNVSMDEHYEASRVLEVQAFRLASARLTDEDCVELRDIAAGLDEGGFADFLRRSVQLRFRIADLSGNPALGLFIRAMARIVTHYVRPDLQPLGAQGGWRRAQTADIRALVESLVAGDAAHGEQAALAELGRRERAARALSAGRPVLTPGDLRRDTVQKRGEQLAFEIMADVAKAGWAAGHRIGDESGLIQHYGVSPWIFRQAVRILEPHEVIWMKRGRRGGLFVGAPTPDYTIESAATFLESVSVGPREVYAGYAELMAVVAQLGVERAAQDERPAFRTVAIEQHLLRASRNQLLSLFGAILHRLLARKAADETDGLIAVRDLLCRAATDGDGPLTRRRMGRYLRALYPSLSG